MRKRRRDQESGPRLETWEYENLVEVTCGQVLDRGRLFLKSSASGVDMQDGERHFDCPIDSFHGAFSSGLFSTRFEDLDREASSARFGSFGLHHLLRSGVI